MSSTTNNTIIYETSGAVASITLNRPPQLNAMNHDMMVAMRAALVRAQDSAIRVLVIRGAGRAFMAGGDVATFAARASELTAVLPSMIGLFHESILLIRNLKKPVIASVHGEPSVTPAAQVPPVMVMRDAATAGVVHQGANQRQRAL